MATQILFSVNTTPRTMTEITRQVGDAVRTAGIACGIAQVFVRHTSCSLLITENADPDVRRDLETLARRWAPDGDPHYRHRMEGADDMSAHARNVLTGSSVSVPVGDGRLLLGTWQGIFLWEHREQGARRDLVVTVVA